MDEDLTQLLDRVSTGDLRARETLVESVYNRLRAMAGRQLRGSSAHSLNATALVHDAYNKLFGSSTPHFEGRHHFFGAAASAMRQAAIEHARTRLAQKRGGGGWQRVTLTGIDLAGATEQVDTLELDTALTDLAAMHQRQAQVVEMRFFAGLSVEEVAVVLGVSSRTVEQDWRTARAWLRNRLLGDEDQS